MSAKYAGDKAELDAKASRLQQPSKLKRRDSRDAKGLASAVPKQAAPKEEKRSPSHTDVGDDSTASRPGSKESKLKPPEIIAKRTSITPTSSLSSMKATEPTRKAPPLPENKQGSFHSITPGTNLPNLSRADSKTGLSLHKVRSVQSLANEIRRIRSSRVDPEEQKQSKPRSRQPPPPLNRQTLHQQPAEEKAEAATTEKRPDKKPSLRSKIKLEIAEPSTIEEQYQLAALPGCQQSASPSRPSTSATSPGSTGKKGVIRNQFTQGLGLNFALDLQPTETRLDKSFDLSASGTFDAVGFQIKETGISRSPDRSSNNDGESSTNKPNAKKHLIKFGVLGRGASGVVHKALHVPSLLLVAVKVIPVFENEKRHQLIAELKTLYNNLSTLTDDPKAKAVACPEIVCLYDAFMNPNEGNVSIVVEYMDGGSLQDIVETGGCKSESVLASISYRVLKGLAFLHSTHQLHRDIKPSNLLINHFGEVKISDFGIVREMENSMAKATTFVGTLTYMSPERIASEAYSYISDVWSFGLSIMTCALGKFPYASKGGYWELLHMIHNEPPPRLPEGDFSPVFRDFLDKCLKKDQSERWSIKQLLRHEFIRQYSTTSSDRAGSSPAADLGDVEEDLEAATTAASEWSRARDGESESDEAKVQVELDEIVQKVSEYYSKDAKELILEEGYSLDEIAAWIQQLPAMQKLKLARFADQIGTRRKIVYAKFHAAMTELLQEIQDTYFYDEVAKDSK